MGLELQHFTLTVQKTSSKLVFNVQKTSVSFALIRDIVTAVRNVIKCLLQIAERVINPHMLYQENSVSNVIKFYSGNVSLNFDFHRNAKRITCPLQHKLLQI